MSNRFYRVGSIYGKRVERILKKRTPLDDSVRIAHDNWKFRVGDTVQIIEGQDKGMTGKITKNIRTHNKVIVEGLNMRIRSAKASPQQSGYLFKKESPIHYSNVAIIDPLSQQPTKIKILTDEAGKRIRVSASTGAVFPVILPSAEGRRKKTVNPVSDTLPEEVHKQTFFPKFLGFTKGRIHIAEKIAKRHLANKGQISEEEQLRIAKRIQRAKNRRESCAKKFSA